MNAIFYRPRTGCPCRAATQPPLRVEIVKRPDGCSRFAVLPSRWVERIFTWFGGNRRLARDYENLAGALAVFIAPHTSASLSGESPGSYRSKSGSKLQEP